MESLQNLVENGQWGEAGGRSLLKKKYIGRHFSLDSQFCLCCSLDLQFHLGLNQYLSGTKMHLQRKRDFRTGHCLQLYFSLTLKRLYPMQQEEDEK